MEDQHVSDIRRCRVSLGVWLRSLWDRLHAHDSSSYAGLEISMYLL